MQSHTLQLRGIAGVIPPPPGVTPNFVRPAFNGQGFLASYVVFGVLSTAFVALRLYTTRFITHRMGLDDYLVALSWLLAVCSSIAAGFWLRHGLGHHLWDVPFSTFNNHFFKVAAICGTFYGISIMFAKLSILVFYLRFSQATSIRITVYVTITIVVIYSVLLSFEWVYACRPIAKYWDLTITGGSCIDIRKIFLASGILNTATDATILFLPVWMLWNLRIPKREKIGVMLVMMTGGLYGLYQPSTAKGSNARTSVLAISVVRLKATADLMGILDVTWALTKASMWGAIEMYVAIVCACLPEGKPFLRRHFPKVLGSTYNSYRDTRSHIRTKSHIRGSGHLKEFSVKHADEIPLRELPKGATDGASYTNGSTCTVEQKESHRHDYV
ncbi:hypothetical protein B0J12DRAFT_607953 [Macrophomina phaseolina]|uniref:Rhodopsin domain-containing protein n=1 Tax=Macrophomina phaseolina TaxID=35725 RepID=A0ABQ8G0K8_9PEZI|nr:hypothetical protein B0J12DRAFT_607953 [Macrophomina phaseolina]